MLTRRVFCERRAAAALIAAYCSGLNILQWGDVYAHHPFRLRLRRTVNDLIHEMPAEKDHLTEPEWRNMLVRAVVRGGLFPPNKITRQMEELGSASRQGPKSAR